MDQRPERKAPPVWSRVATALAVCIAAGFAAGWFLHGSLNAPTPPALRMIRDRESPGWRFINPLLECDVAEPLVQRSELVSFRGRLESLVEERRASGQIETASLYFRELNDGPWIGINERVGYLPASLLKLPTLISVLKRAEHDPGFLAREVVYKGRHDENSTIFFRPPETLQTGRSYTVEQLSRRMARYSDNNATGMLNALVTAPEQSAVLRGLGVLPAWVQGGGTLDVRALSSFLRVLFNASYLSREHSELALEMLSQSFFRAGIIAGVPEDVQVCSKYGEAAVGPGLLQLHEFAIVYHERRPYLLGVMTRGRDFATLARLIRDLSRTVYEEVDRETREQVGGGGAGAPG